MFLSLISSGLGVVLGAFLTNRYNRKAKFEELKVKLNLEKHSKYNKLWDSLAYVQAIIRNTPDFPALWNIHNVFLLESFKKSLFDAHESYIAIDSQMSQEMGALYEYLTKYLIGGRLLGPMDVPIQTSESICKALLGLYDSVMQLMMDLLKTECNQQAIEALLYGDEAGYNRAMDSYRDRMKKFISDHKEFEQIKDILQKNNLGMGQS